MTTTRNYQIATIHPEFGRIGTQCRLQYAEALGMARLNNASALRNHRVERYVVEATASTKRAEAMPV